VQCALAALLTRSTVNAETGKVQQRLQFDASDIANFERRLNELVDLFVFIRSLCSCSCSKCYRYSLSCKVVSYFLHHVVYAFEFLSHASVLL